MPPIFIFPFFILFLLLLAFFIRKSNNAQQAVEDSFWEREQEANHARRKDISNLDYIIIPLEKFPLNLGTESEQKLKALAEKKILNLTGLSNTDLKLQYGPANLDALSEYDENFVQLISTLPVYAQELLDAGDTKGAQAVLEFGVECRADIGKIYTMLADLYIAQGQPDKIQALIDAAGELSSLSKNVIVGKLKELT